MADQPAFRLPVVISVAALAAAVLVSLTAASVVEYYRASPLTEAATLVVPKGTSVRGIGRLLTEHGVIRSPAIFAAAVVVVGEESRLRAGEYAFTPGVTLSETIRKLATGDVVAHRFTVAEGQSSASVVEQLNATAGLVGDAGPVPPEGSLLPETYHYTYGDDRRVILQRMRTAMDVVIDRLWDQRASDLPFQTKAEAAILASIVERETAIPAERPRIAAVFVNRLRLGMRLQADPTVAYAASDHGAPLNRPLTRADLERPSPFNTYLVDGLPPAAIANPGRASIEAVLRPAETDELYFVADGFGGHAFARTLDEHNRNVSRWRLTRRDD